MKTEKQLHNYMKREAGKAGILFHKLESRSCNGFPDVLLVRASRVVFVELKSPAGTGSLSPIQIHTIEELREHGAEVHVIDSKAGADLILSSFS